MKRVIQRDIKERGVKKQAEEDFGKSWDIYYKKFKNKYTKNINEFYYKKHKYRSNTQKIFWMSLNFFH